MTTSTRGPGHAAGFVPPPYPYTRLDALHAEADQLVGGVVDCSIGTPCDPPPSSVIRALAVSGTERGYPSSAGSPALRRAASEWLRRRFDVTVEPSMIAACVGTKEFVASVAHLLQLRDPSRDTVLYPAVSYPTYAMGAELAGCRAVPIEPATADGSGLALDRLDPSDVERAVVLWANSPSNPSGGLSDLAEVAAFGRRHGVPVLSDECYTEFTWEGPATSVLQHGTEGVLAVHSLSKRSNLAGIRSGLYAGDPELVSYLRDVRQHAGLMVPGPVQAASAVALADDEHVSVQRERYLERLRFLADVFGRIGCPVELPAGGFYLWVPVGERWKDDWALTADLARVGGFLVSPGELYGSAGNDHVRVAAVQPMARLQMVADRLSTAGWL
jgi:aspartate/methionine/tyrosine aminotransferase